MAEPTEKQKIGRLGEDIALKYLENKGFLTIERNYLKKCGEIDIIMKKGKILHFIEVKSVSEPAGSRLGRSEKMGHSRFNVSLRPRREFANSETDAYRPEDNIHPHKLKRLARTAQVYLIEKYPEGEPEWQFSAIVVEINLASRRARVQLLADLVL